MGGSLVKEWGGREVGRSKGILIIRGWRGETGKEGEGAIVGK